jgi:hypothetical protein
VFFTQSSQRSLGAWDGQLSTACGRARHRLKRTEPCDLSQLRPPHLLTFLLVRERFLVFKIHNPAPNLCRLFFMGEPTNHPHVGLRNEGKHSWDPVYSVTDYLSQAHAFALALAPTPTPPTLIQWFCMYVCMYVLVVRTAASSPSKAREMRLPVSP